jgi:hypothetical protein
VAGQALSIRDVRRAVQAGEGKLYFEDAATPVARELVKKGTPVLVSGPWLGELSAWEIPVRTLQASREFILPKLLKDQNVPPAARSFLTTLRWADSKTGAKYQSIQAADFAYPGSPIQDRLFVTQKSPGTLGGCSERPRSSLLGFRRERLHALVNPDDPFLKELAALHETRPGLSAYLCLKVMHLSDGEVPPESEEQYCNLALELERRLLESALQLDTAAPTPLRARA